jgi:hypothetical protein
MGWAIGESQGRDVGYGVPAYCDHPGCRAEIDRGLGYICGGEPGGGERGCGLFFCGQHLGGMHCRCTRCTQGEAPFTPTPDHPNWIRWKLTNESWRQWRDQNPGDVAKLQHALLASSDASGAAPGAAASGSAR